MKKYKMPVLQSAILNKYTFSGGRAFYYRGKMEELAEYLTSTDIRKSEIKTLVESLLRGNVRRNSQSWFDYRTAKQLIYKIPFSEWEYQEAIRVVCDYIDI